jgi:hypothetical protein
VRISEVLQVWTYILSGRTPSISIELTRECPLRCPGCYAYEDAHLGLPGVTLRQLADFKGSALVQSTLRLIDEYRPLHVSLVPQGEIRRGAPGAHAILRGIQPPTSHPGGSFFILLPSCGSCSYVRLGSSRFRRSNGCLWCLKLRKSFRSQRALDVMAGRL